MILRQVGRFRLLKYFSAFGDWSSWSECSRTCGGGSRSKVRNTINGKLGDYGCDGDSLIAENCNTCSCASKFYQ